MNFWRNGEVKIELAVFVILGIAAGIFGYASDADYANGKTGVNAATGMLLAAAVAICALLHFVLTYLRYRKISRFSSELDKILHGESISEMKECHEGELSILQYEMNQVLLRLKEQTDVLQRDKLYLADSLADISHQLKTPLTSMNLILTLLNEPGITEERHAELVKELNKLTERLRWLIETLLKISKLDAGTVKLAKDKLAVKDLLQTVMIPLEIPMELKEQQLIADIPEDATFLGDMRWTAEAIGNILKNCMEHTPVGGTLYVTCRENPMYTEIVMEDNGPGMDEADLPHLFERFYKGKHSSADSVGIGLALARMIIVQQNGTIKAENRRSGAENQVQGARFIVRFYKTVV